MAKWGRNPAGNPRFLPAEQMEIGHPVYEMGSVDPNTTPGGIPSGSQMSIRRSSDVFPSGDTSGSSLKIINPYSGSAGTSALTPAEQMNAAMQGIDLNTTAAAPITSALTPAEQMRIAMEGTGQGGGFSNFTANLNNGSRTGDVRNPLIDTNNAEAIRIQNEIDTANALAEARARAAAEAEAQAIANAKAQAELDRINADNAAASAAEVASGSSGINAANTIGNGGNGMANGNGYSYPYVY